jgi:hypothetical protein
MPREFEDSESEIKILKVIRSGDNAVVYRIAARGVQSSNYLPITQNKSYA